MKYLLISIVNVAMLYLAFYVINLLSRYIYYWWSVPTAILATFVIVVLTVIPWYIVGPHPKQEGGEEV